MPFYIYNFYECDWNWPKLDTNMRVARWNNIFSFKKLQRDILGVGNDILGVLFSIFTILIFDGKWLFI